MRHQLQQQALVGHSLSHKPCTTGSPHMPPAEASRDAHLAESVIAGDEVMLCDELFVTVFQAEFGIDRACQLDEEAERFGVDLVGRHAMKVAVLDPGCSFKPNLARLAGDGALTDAEQQSRLPSANATCSEIVENS